MEVPQHKLLKHAKQQENVTYAQEKILWENPDVRFNKKVKAAIINMFKLLKETIFKEVKEGKMKCFFNREYERKDRKKIFLKH